MKWVAVLILFTLLIGLRRCKKKPKVPVDPMPRLSEHDPNWLRKGNNLQKHLDDVCIKHHGMLPYENDDDIDW